jgi:hypothetical protein
MRPLREAHPQPPTGWPGREYQRPAVLAPCGVAGGPARWHPATGHGARHVEPARVTRESEPALRGRYEGERPGASAGPWRPPGHGIWASSLENLRDFIPETYETGLHSAEFGIWGSVSYMGRRWTAKGPRFHTWGVRGPPRGRGFIRGAYVDRHGAGAISRGAGERSERRGGRAAGRASGGEFSEGWRRRRLSASAVVFGRLTSNGGLGYRRRTIWPASIGLPTRHDRSRL